MPGSMDCESKERRMKYYVETFSSGEPNDQPHTRAQRWLNHMRSKLNGFGLEAFSTCSSDGIYYITVAVKGFEYDGTGPVQTPEPPVEV